MTRAVNTPQSPRRVFTEEYKREMVRLFESSSKTMAAFCKETGLVMSVMDRWKRQFGVASRQSKLRNQRPEVQKQDEPEVSALKRRIRDLEVELDVVKKSHAFFARDRI